MMKQLRFLLATLMAVMSTSASMAETVPTITIGGYSLPLNSQQSYSVGGEINALKSGTVTYYPSTKTLELNGVKIEAGDNSGIAVNNQPITIKLVGTNTISATGYNAALSINQGATIMGSGSLSLTSEGDCGIYLTSSSSSTLTIKACTLTAEGTWGVSGFKTGGVCYGNLVIDQANVSAKSTSSDGSICDFATMTMNNCSIISPEGADWNEDKHAVCKASGVPVYNDWVVITKNAVVYDVVVDGIYYKLNGTTATVTNKTGGEDGTYADEMGLITIPETITVDGKTYTVTGIASYAFDHYSGVLTLPSTIQSIADYAFKGTAMVLELNWPTPLTYNDSWFGNSKEGAAFIPTGTKDAYFAAGWPQVDNYPLLEKPNHTQNGLHYALNPTKHTAIITGDMLERYKTMEESVTDLHDVVVPETITVKGVTYTVTEIQTYGFICTSMTSLTLPHTISEIGMGAFVMCMCSAPSLTIPSSMTTIGMGAFEVCAISTYYIPSTVTKIEDNAFGRGDMENDALTLFCSSATPPELEGDPFDGVKFANSKLYVPEASVDLYKAAEGWKQFGNIQPFTNRCAKPTITVAGNAISFACATEGAVFHSTVTLANTSSHTPQITIGNTYNISVYASADGYCDSEAVTQQVTVAGIGSGTFGDLTGDDKVTIADVTKLVNIILGE